MRNKKYQIIYADPPWQYNRKAGQGIAADHYPTMSLQEICDLPVGKLADKDCVLFLWVTFPQLREGLSVIQAWGFQYKTVAFVWVKKNKKADTLFLGLGHWTRSNAEIVCLQRKGLFIGNQHMFDRLFYHTLKDTVKNQMWQEIELLSLLVMYRE